MFNPVRTRIEDILNSPARFQIPRYQRDYKWGKEEAIELIDDLKNCVESGEENLFLGSLIFECSQEKEKILQIVDGQQRMTTIVLLLIACRTRVRALGDANLAGLIQGKVTFVDSTTGKSLGSRLVASESIRDVFDYICDGDWDGAMFPAKLKTRHVKRQVNRIRPVYAFFLEQIGNLELEELSNFLKAIYNAYVVRIDIKNEVEALNIFERTNARGMDLEISDLLKNYLFAREVKDIEGVWNEIAANADGTMPRMLKYFYVSKKGYVLKPHLYKKLKAYGIEVGATQLTTELKEFSDFYRITRLANAKETQEYLEQIGCSAIASDQEKYEAINYALQGLRLFNVVQFCPLAFAAVECYVRTKLGVDAKKSKHLIRFFEALERYHFINNDVCDRVGNEVEKLYAEYSVEFKESKDFVTTIGKFIAELREKVASEGEFVERFTDISYSADEIARLSYIFDRINNAGLPPASRINIYSPDPKLLRRNHNIEHIFPRNPEKGAAADPKTMEVVDNIGNLLAISFRTNSKLGNLRPEAKMKKLAGELTGEIQNLSHVRDFLRDYEAAGSKWGREIIQKRAREMAADAYSRVWAIN